MSCAGCGRKYRSAGSSRVKASLPVKYQQVNKPSKKVPSVAPATPAKIDPQTAIGLMSSIANSMPK